MKTLVLAGALEIVRRMQTGGGAASVNTSYHGGFGSVCAGEGGGAGWWTGTEGVEEEGEGQAEGEGTLHPRAREDDARDSSADGVGGEGAVHHEQTGVGGGGEALSQLYGRVETLFSRMVHPAGA